MKTLSILLLTDSVIISEGISLILANRSKRKVYITTLSYESLANVDITEAQPDIVFVDPNSVSRETLLDLRNSLSVRATIVGVYTSALPPAVNAFFDTTLSIYSPVSAFEAIFENNDRKQQSESDQTDELTPREKEIIIGVVKGLTNKEIAASLNVSVHTVMTHRRNISNKLQIHSPAALTIYAIVRKLIPVDALPLP